MRKTTTPKAAAPKAEPKPKAAPKTVKPKATKPKATRTSRPKAEPKPKVFEFDFESPSELRELAMLADMRSAVVAEATDKTNVFAQAIDSIAESARKLADLIEERGHTGCPILQEEL